MVLWVGMGNGLLVEAGAQGVLRLKLGARLPAPAYHSWSHGRPKLDAGELMSLLRGNPRYMLSPVDACLWRQRCDQAAGKYAVAGFRRNPCRQFGAGLMFQDRCIVQLVA